MSNTIIGQAAEAKPLLPGGSLHHHHNTNASATLSGVHDDHGVDGKNMSGGDVVDRRGEALPLAININNPIKDPGLQQEGHKNRPYSYCKGSSSLLSSTVGGGGVVVKYMECLKNHAAAIGGNAKDGCGEFMAGGEEGTLEALKCSACNCHRNFHRKIVQQQHIVPAAAAVAVSKKTNSVAELAGLALRSGHLHADHWGTAEGGEEEAGGGSAVARKRQRTKFTKEQKEKMLGFAERAGWKMQKLEESEVRRFCQEVGIKRKVLKVWMHNNKYHHHLSKKGTIAHDEATTSHHLAKKGTIAHDEATTSHHLAKKGCDDNLRRQQLN